MKKTAKQLLALVLTAVMVITVVPFIVSNAESTDYTVGDIVEFGSYPQSEITDITTLAALDAQTLNWVSYGYYSGKGSQYDSSPYNSYGTMTASPDYMRYADVTYNGDKYRAVTFDTYRPKYTRYYSSSSNSFQDDNGYITNRVYWFKYEPIEWRVLDPATGLIMCETIIDSQPYSNTIYLGLNYYYNDLSCAIYANDYATSSIREWLNDDFYNTAFTSGEQSEIESTTIDNSAYSDSYSIYDSLRTTDKIFLLSYDEAQEGAYGLGISTAREVQGSDYAKSQGLKVSGASSYGGNSNWLLRSPSSSSNRTCYVNYDGSVYYNGVVEDTGYGIRPALRITNLSSLNQETTETATTTTESTTILEVPTTQLEEPTSVSNVAPTTKPTTPEVTTIPTDEVEIKTPSQTEISYGDKIVLHMYVDLPSGAKVVWSADNDNFSYSVSADGKTCTISPEKSGDTTFTAKVVDKNGNVISEEYNQTMTSNAGFFQKIIAFFKGLFGMNKVIPQRVKFDF